MNSLLEASIHESLTELGKVLLVSDSIEALLGFKPADFLSGKVSLQSRIHADDQDIAESLFSTDITQPYGIFNIRLRQANGRIRCIKGTYTKVKPSNGITLELLLQDAKSLQQDLATVPVMSNFKAIMENTDDFIFFKDRNHVITGASQTLVGVTSPSEHWTDLLGQTDYDVFPESYADSYYHLEKLVFSGLDVAHQEQETLDNDGNKGWVDNRKYPIQDDNGVIIGLFGVARDITEQKQAELKLKIAATVFESQEGMLVTDANNIILRVNQAFTNITGYSAEDAIGQTPQILGSGRQNKAFYDAMWAKINTTGAWDGEIWNRRKSGEVYPEHLSITAVIDLSGSVTNYVASLTDITMSKAASDKIKNLAFYDPLTQLANRRLLIDRLNQALTVSARSSQYGALLFLDLDHFKTLNDTLGHDVGDVLLQQVAERLTASVRESDTVSRVGGDEFVVLLEDLSKKSIEAAAETKNVAEKILVALNEPYLLNTHTHYSTPSIGATVFNGHEQEVEELLKQADIAMYQSKTDGRNTLRFFDLHMQEVITSRAVMENELRQAIQQDQFELHYQVQVGSAGQAIGAEALIRWHHPQRGMVPPFEFIPLAEEIGLILPIGQWVLDTACAQLKTWQNKPISEDLVIAINVSAKQFFQIDFVEQVKATMKRHQINPRQLKLELTESMLVENINDIISKMDALSKIGICFSLDDFGTGYSSLQYLKKLPLNQLKIDQSFVRDLVTDISDRAIVRTIITMAYSLEISVIAEGVETIEQKQYLLDNGCQFYQGYLFSRPVPIDKFEALLSKLSVNTSIEHEKLR